MAQAQKVLKEAGKLNLVDSSGIDKKVESVTAAKALDAVADSGKVFVLNLAGGFTVTLPAVADASGFSARFIVGIAPTTAYIVSEDTSADTNVVHGVVSTAEAGGAAANTDGTPVTQVNFVASNAAIGDYVDVVCDGSKWLVLGQAADDANITFS